MAPGFVSPVWVTGYCISSYAAPYCATVSSVYLFSLEALQLAKARLMSICHIHCGFISAWAEQGRGQDSIKHRGGAEVE